MSDKWKQKNKTSAVVKISAKMKTKMSAKTSVKASAKILATAIVVQEMDKIIKTVKIEKNAKDAYLFMYF